jgi:photosystem II stability/assembly factor-like uncharacterized protein
MVVTCLKFRKRNLIILAGLVCAVFALAACSRSSKEGVHGDAHRGPIPAVTFGDKFYDITAPNKSNIWVVGYFGSITHSSDEGKTFVRQDAKTSNALTGVSFINPKEGWIVGDQGTILHTSDGGTTWDKQKSPVTDQKLLKVQFLNDKEGFAVGTFGTIVGTKDGGNTWEKLPYKEDIILNDLFFFNPREGYVVGEFETILHTTDGGKSWTKQRGDQLGKLFGIAFKDPRNGIAVGTAGKILTTSDGRNWKELKGPTDDTLLKAIYTGDKIVAVGLRGAVVAGDGRTWHSVLIPGHYSWLCAIAQAGGAIYTAGSEGKILISNDSGKKWTPIGLPSLASKEQ